MSLFIDTSNFRLIIAVVDEDNNIVLTLCDEKMNGDLSTKIFPIIEKCIRDAGLVPEEINKIYSVVGPGSFTGVRIGVTIAKTFAWARKIPVIELSSLEVLASSNVESKYIVPMIDARRNCVFAGIYDNELNVIMNDAYISLDDLKNNIPVDNSVSFISDDKITYFDEVVEPSIDVLKVINKHKNDEPITPHLLVPKYLKITEAEANLNNKNND